LLALIINLLDIPGLAFGLSCSQLKLSSAQLFSPLLLILLAAMATSLHLSLAAAAPAPASSLRSAAAFVGGAGSLSRPMVSHRSRAAGNLVVQAKIREIFMPALSSTMTEGKIVSWMKNEGDKLSKGMGIALGFKYSSHWEWRWVAFGFGLMGV